MCVGATRPFEEAAQCSMQREDRQGDGADRKRLERAKTRETAYFLASASKRSAEEGDQKEAKKRVVEVEVHIPLPDLPMSTSPDPLPAVGVKVGESVMEGKAVDQPWS